MAWGNFCVHLYPVKRWDSKHTSLMLGFLPLIGLAIGIVWSAAYFGLVYLGFPFFVVSFIITFLPFALCGFMHMDGFMDCCDAIMSRRPLEDRQRILKDSNTGAFAVVSMIFLVLGYFCFLSTAITAGVDFVNMIMIVVVSRSVAGLHVLSCRPMRQSQYAAMQESETSKTLANSETEIITAAAAKNASQVSESDCDCDCACDSTDTAVEQVCEAAESKAAEAATSESTTVESKTPKRNGIILLCVLFVIIAALAFWSSSYYAATALVTLFTAAGSLIAIQFAKKNLGGMSGDIAGYGIVWGELIGVFALTLC